MKLGQGMNNIRMNKLASFSSIQCTIFKKMTIITYNQFTLLSKSVMWDCIIFGIEMHYNGIYWLAKFHPNLVCILWNIGSRSLAATHFYSCSSTKVQKLKWEYISIGKLDSHSFCTGSIYYQDKQYWQFSSQSNVRFLRKWP